MGLFDFLRTNKPLEPVTLPVIFSNVAYMVFGERSYAGELIVAPDAIFYFPHTNLSPQDRQKEKIIWTGVRDLIREFWRSELDPGQASISGGTSGGVTPSVEEKIELLMKYVKENRQDTLLADSTPAPVKFSRDGIQKLRVGWGSLKFDANFDDHEFQGLNGGLLQRALKSGGYVT
ncbi:MAG TPA: hypothetical protein VEM96_01180 [Pyrinomonadaceae bacterium]|nr:hypothetical protein [Pyrinomonadaceae bacterium]